MKLLAYQQKIKIKKRKFNIDKFKWFDNPLDLISDSLKPNILIELIGEEEGISFTVNTKQHYKKKYM